MGRPINCGRCNKPKRPKGRRFKELEGYYCGCGRPTVLTENVLNKLEQAFRIGLNDVKSCLYAGISTQAMYNYQDKNPEFTERKEQLRAEPDIRAKMTVVNSLSDPSSAWRWLERRDPDFKPVAKIETNTTVEFKNVQISEEERQALEILQLARRKRIQDGISPEVIDVEVIEEKKINTN